MNGENTVNVPVRVISKLAAAYVKLIDEDKAERLRIEEEKCENRGPIAKFFLGSRISDDTRITIMLGGERWHGKVREVHGAAKLLEATVTAEGDPDYQMTVTAEVLDTINKELGEDVVRSTMEKKS